MRQNPILWSVLSFLFLSAPAAGAQTAKAVLSGTSPDSEISGEILLEQKDNGLQITGSIQNAPPGEHGFHIHQYGECSEEGNAAGGHFNPHEVEHGYLPDEGFEEAHAGDFGNVEIDADGTGSVDLTIPGLQLIDKHTGVLGRAFVLHENPDDFGQPTGNAGGRMACGPIVLAKS